MSDSDFLDWIASRFVNIHGESENVDFVLRLREMATELRERSTTEEVN